MLGNLYWKLDIRRVVAAPTSSAGCQAAGPISQKSLVPITVGRGPGPWASGPAALPLRPRPNCWALRAAASGIGLLPTSLQLTVAALASGRAELLNGS
eukprot:8804513-Alexandrium_andersonii.AAC.1